jgi:hypothetical protein
MTHTSVRLHSEFDFYSLQTHRETDRFFEASGVQSAQSTSDQFHFRRAASSSGLKNQGVLDLVKAVALRINLDLEYRI